MNLTNQTLSARKSQGSWGQWLPFDSSRLQAHPSKHSACGSAPARQCSCGSAPPREKTDQRSSSSQTPRKPCPSGRTHGMLTSQLQSMTPLSIKLDLPIKLPWLSNSKKEQELNLLMAIRLHQHCQQREMMIPVIRVPLNQRWID